MDFFAFDDDYVRRLREGDRPTEEHYEHYFRLFLSRTLRRRRMPPGEIDDVIQTTHLRVYQELRTGEGIRDGHAFGGYVHKTCIHVAQEAERKRRVTVEIDNEWPSDDADALREFITRESSRRVRDTLRELEAEHPRDGAILRELFIEERDKAEICARYGVDREYLRVLVFRALRKFREMYGEPGQ